MGRQKRTPELEAQILNRLKFGMTKIEIQRELGVGCRIADAIYKENGFDKRPIEKGAHFPPELLAQWDALHRRYGTCQK